MKECNVKAHKRKDSKVRAHTRTLETSADKSKKNVLSKRGTDDLQNSEIAITLGENHSSKSGSHLFLYPNGTKRCR